MAELVPAAGAKHADSVAAVEDMRRFMHAAPPVRGVDLKALINEGRA